jgi:hypothetical protein
VKIVDITYDPPGNDVEGEYVRLENQGGSPAPMGGWTLRDIANATYSFPAGFTLQSGAYVNVWVKPGVNTATDLFWGYNRPIWNNDGDCAYLHTQTGEQVHEMCYR